MEIRDIKERLGLNRVLQHYNLKPDKNKRLRCPFHNDKTPSLQVYPETNTVYCFSSNCKTHGKAIDQIDFIMHKENCTKHEAIKKAKFMLDGVEVEMLNHIDIKPTKAEPEANIEILSKIFNYFRNGFIMRKDNKARNYLQGRNLDVSKLENLGIRFGYNSAQFHHRNRISPEDMQACEKSGLLIKSTNGSKTEYSYTPWASHCTIFPLTDEKGNITGMYGRASASSATTRKSKPASAKATAGRHYYLKNSKGLFYYPKSDSKKLIITESIIDFLSLYQIDEIRKYYTFLPIYGTNRLNGEHKTAINKLEHLQEIIFFLDGDKAGDEAIKKYADELRLQNEAIQITKVETPQDEDINSLLESYPENYTGLINELLENRIILFSSIETVLLSSVEEKKNETEQEPVPPEPITKTELPVMSVAELNIKNTYNIIYTGTSAIYSIKGFRVQQLDSLKVSIQITHPDTKEDYRTKLDLYEYKQLTSTAKTSAEKLNLRVDFIEKEMSKLTNLLEDYKNRKMTETKENGNNNNEKIKVPEATMKKCITFLKTENLIPKFNNLIGKAGITGENKNRILLFVIASSYKMPDTLHALIQGSSGSGKTRLLKISSDLMPPEDIKRYTRVTDNSFYNQDEYFFVNKLVCFEDMDGLGEDAQLAVRELQSNEILRTSTSLKDKNGNIGGGERIVRGPIASLSCTTNGETYEDNISRSFLIAVDESREQTSRIIEYQNKVYAGIINKDEQKQVINFVQNCIRFIKPYNVINPYAGKIKLPQEAHKIRRLNELYQCFVRQITLLNQYQRRRASAGDIIYSTKEDMQIACDILFESIVLKVDELDGSLRQFFEKLKDYVLQKGRNHDFTQREIRQELNISKAQCSRNIGRLRAMEYLTSKYENNQRKVHYSIDYWDNHAKLRARIKEDLTNQINKL
ncbi:MAG: toprim domain-containing protein [Bacteroidales bacterium]|nr:toprim domain-containing protein [Bacteroidales bacterium]